MSRKMGEIRWWLGILLVVMSAGIGWFTNGFWLGVVPACGGAIGGACIWSLNEDEM